MSSLRNEPLASSPIEATVQVIPGEKTADTRTAAPPEAVRNAPQRTFSISSHVIPGLVAALDSVVILSTALITYLVVVADFIVDPSYYAAAVGFVWVATMMLMNFAGLYQFEPIMRPLTVADKILIAFATTFLFLLAAAFSLKISDEYSRIWVGSFAIGACTATMVFRLLASRVLGRLADMRVFSRNVVIVGAGEQARKLLVHVEKSRPRFVSVLGLFADSPHELADARYPTLGRINDLDAYIRRNDVDDVIISLPWSADEQITTMVTKLRELPVNVYLGSDLIGFRLPFRPPPDHFGELPLVEVMGRPLAGWGGLQKTALDYSLGIILTLLLLPVMMLIAIAIKLESKGPVVFRQERFGFVNKIFRIYKFRTMKHAAAPEKTTIQATRSDPRVTRVGRFLRRMSFDELPQLFNVLNGTMSLVGPRPHAVDHNEAYAKMIRSYFARHRVKPGLTGWAQVNGFRGEIKTLDEIEARVRYDIYYAENWSLLFDLKILAMTFVVCLTGRKAY
jgi:putative colanic acid biosysnthesis UDP-glucose lipid carrier transferase